MIEELRDDIGELLLPNIERRDNRNIQELIAFYYQSLRIQLTDERYAIIEKKGILKVC